LQKSRGTFAACGQGREADSRSAKCGVRSDGGSGMVAPELAKLQQQRERLRYEKEESMINFLRDSGRLRPGLSHKAARDVVWMLTEGCVPHAGVGASVVSSVVPGLAGRHPGAFPAWLRETRAQVGCSGSWSWEIGGRIRNFLLDRDSQLSNCKTIVMRGSTLVNFPVANTGRFFARRFFLPRLAGSCTYASRMGCTKNPYNCNGHGPRPCVRDQLAL
jgi:hypothetical protein